MTISRQTDFKSSDEMQPHGLHPYRPEFSAWMQIDVELGSLRNDDEPLESPFFHRGDKVAENMTSAMAALAIIVLMGVMLMPVVWKHAATGLSDGQRAAACWMATGLCWTALFELMSSPNYDGADGDASDPTDRSASNTKIALRAVMVMGAKRALLKLEGSLVSPCPAEMEYRLRAHVSVFGRNIEDVCMEEGTFIPRVVDDTLRWLSSHGTAGTEGLFRSRGDPGAIASIRLKYDRGHENPLDGVTDPYVVAGVLKQYFASLPEPILSFSMYDAFLCTMSIPKESTRIATLRRLLADLAPPLHLTLRELLAFLHQRDLATRQGPQAGPARISMPPPNLAALFAPLLLRMRLNNVGQVAEDVQTATQVVAALIDHHAQLFPEPRPASRATTGGAGSARTPPKSPIRSRRGGGGTEGSGGQAPSPEQPSPEARLAETRIAECVGGALFGGGGGVGLWAWDAAEGLLACAGGRHRPDAHHARERARSAAAARTSTSGRIASAPRDPTPVGTAAGSLPHHSSRYGAPAPEVAAEVAVQWEDGDGLESPGTSDGRGGRVVQGWESYGGRSHDLFRERGYRATAGWLGPGVTASLIQSQPPAAGGVGDEPPRPAHAAAASSSSALQHQGAAAGGGGGPGLGRMFRPYTSGGAGTGSAAAAAAAAAAGVYGGELAASRAGDRPAPRMNPHAMGGAARGGATSTIRGPLQDLNGGPAGGLGGGLPQQHPRAAWGSTPPASLAAAGGAKENSPPAGSARAGGGVGAQAAAALAVAKKIIEAQQVPGSALSEAIAPPPAPLSGGWSVDAEEGSKPLHHPPLRTMTREEMASEKSRLKRELKMADSEFARRAGRKPTREEKEHLRPVYVRYWKLKKRLGGAGGD